MRISADRYAVDAGRTKRLTIGAAEQIGRADTAGIAGQRGERRKCERPGKRDDRAAGEQRITALLQESCHSRLLRGCATSGRRTSTQVYYVVSRSRPPRPQRAGET